MLQLSKIYISTTITQDSYKEANKQKNHIIKMLQAIKVPNYS